MKKIFLFSFVAFSFAAQAQKVSNKISFTKGQKLEMVTQSKGTISQEVMGQTMDINMSSSLTRMFDIADVANGNTTIEHKLKRLQFNMDAMGQSQSFDSEKEEDMKSEMGKNMEKALKNKYTMTLDGKGWVTAVKADDDNPNKTKGDDEAADQVLQQFGADMSLPKVGSASAFSILPAKEVTKGETWIDSLTTSPDVKGKTTYTVTDITANDVLVDFVQEANMTRVQEMMGAEANVTMNTKVTGKITLDKKSGLLKQRISSTEGKGQVEVMGQTIPVTSKTTETTTVVAK